MTNSLPTEAEVMTYKDHHLTMLDKQDGKIQGFDGLITLSDELLAQIDERIKKWMETEDHYLEINIGESEDSEHYDLLQFEKYITHFVKSANTSDQWMIVKCMQRGFPKMYTKHLLSDINPFMSNLDDNGIPTLHNLIFSTGYSVDDSNRKYSSAINDKEGK